jgi:glycosyltransferase involved in cell wall biosynthesis
MISVCIPVYNIDVRELVSRLHELGTTSGIAFEIFVIDDASTDLEKQRKNVEIDIADNIRYKILPSNKGRSLIRFELANHATFDHLLFIDADSWLPDSLYLTRYLQANWRDHLIVGGISYIEERPNRDQLLHWKYGSRREQRNATVRSLDPYRSFLGCNFLISKKHFFKLQVDSNLEGYGHEDTFMGMQLEKLMIPVKHIDNPVIHTGLEQTTQFIRKQEQALCQLNYIYKKYGDTFPVVRQVRLLQVFEKLRKTGTLGIYKQAFSSMRNMIFKNLHSSQPNLSLLDLHKLGIFIENYSRD